MFKVLKEAPYCGRIGAGELVHDWKDGEASYPAATHRFEAGFTRDGLAHVYSGVTDGEGHADLARWAKALDGANVTFANIKAPAALAAPKAEKTAA